MTDFEGITPHEKHQTIEDRRGKFEPHHEIRARSMNQQQFVWIIALVSVVVLVGAWILLAKNGILFKSSSSDQEFVNAITGTLDSNQQAAKTTDTNSSKNVTSEEKKVLEDVDQELFPEFQQ